MMKRLFTLLVIFIPFLGYAGKDNESDVRVEDEKIYVNNRYYARIESQGGASGAFYTLSDTGGRKVFTIKFVAGANGYYEFYFLQQHRRVIKDGYIGVKDIKIARFIVSNHLFKGGILDETEAEVFMGKYGQDGRY